MKTALMPSPADARREIRDAHATPTFDLVTEPWLPVIRTDGDIEKVSLSNLLRQAHLITDLVEPDPLTRAATRRFLQGLVADLVRRADDMDALDWSKLHASNSGFPEHLVEETLTAHHDHLWLWHPHTPFLQDMRLADALVTVDTVPIQDIAPELPSATTATWFVKPGDRVFSTPVSSTQVIGWLLTRWWYALPGNTAAVATSDGTVVANHGGGAFSEGIATLTHAWRIDATSLFRTLLRNLTTETAEGGPGTCAWMDPNRPTPTEDRLYLATTTATATLLAARDGSTGAVTGVLRGPIPIDKEVLKHHRDLALNSDPHRVKIVAGKKQRVLRVTPASQRTELLRQFYRDGIESGTELHGVVTSTLLWIHSTSADAETLELLFAEKSGMAASPGWFEIGSAALPARYVDPDHPKINEVRAAVAVAFAPRKGLYDKLGYATSELMRPARANEQPVSGMVESVRENWTTRVAALLRLAFDGDAAVDDDWQSKVYREARLAFTETFQPYAASTRYAAPFAKALNYLTNRRTS